MAKTSYKLIIRPPGKMRYPTTGDYYKTKNGWMVEVADLGNPDYNFLVLIHEVIELYLTQRRRISEPAIKKFDEWFEREKDRGRFRKIMQPGRHPRAPYRREHLFSEKIEKILIKEMGINKLQYEKTEDKIYNQLKEKFKKLYKHK